VLGGFHQVGAITCTGQVTVTEDGRLSTRIRYLGRHHHS
jgi:hypothetical protein